MAAFGGVAVGERRPGWDRPGRSGLLGLIGAALGLDRADEAAQHALANGYGIAVRTDARGRLLTDYHTVQVPPVRRGHRHATRAEELADRPLETILTRREYRTDAFHLVALWARDSAPTPLPTIAAALRHPAHTLSVGRKSCPLGLPLAPLLVEAADPVAALQVRAEAASPPERSVRNWLGARAGTVALDLDGLPSQATARRIEQRRDQPVHRGRWQFALRDEAVLTAPEKQP